MVVKIELENMEFRANHGCYDMEKIVGNHCEVSLAIDAEIGDAAQKDELLKTVNYVVVYKLVKEQMEQPSNTLENVALRILDALYISFTQIIKATVKVSKYAPPIGGKMERFSVTLTK